MKKKIGLKIGPKKAQKLVKNVILAGFWPLEAPKYFSIFFLLDRPLFLLNSNKLLKLEHYQLKTVAVRANFRKGTNFSVFRKYKNAFFSKTVRDINLRFSLNALSCQDASPEKKTLTSIMPEGLLLSNY